MKKDRSVRIGVLFAILAAALYAVNAPFSKLLLDFMPPTLMAGFLYLGAGVGMGVVALARGVKGRVPVASRMTRADLPYAVAMVLLDYCRSDLSVCRILK